MINKPSLPIQNAHFRARWKTFFVPVNSPVMQGGIAQRQLFSAGTARCETTHSRYFRVLTPSILDLGGNTVVIGANEGYWTFWKLAYIGTSRGNLGGDGAEIAILERRNQRGKT